MKKVLLFIFCICFLSVEISAQYEDDFEKSHARVLSDIIPPSPSVSSLGTYGSTSVNLYVGRPNIQIPIYTISEGRFQWPISLSYTGGGIKVSQIASWVGLGWSLHADGVVSRTIQGLPDDLNGRGIFHSPQIVNCCDEINAAEGDYDYQPDEYSFNFNGYNGRLFIESDGTANGTEISVQPVQQIQVELEFGIVDGSSAITKWIITTPDGMQYFFGQSYDETRDAFEKLERTNECGGLLPIGRFISAWHLLEIRDTYNNGDIADFYYSDVTECYGTEEYDSYMTDLPFGNCQETIISHCGTTTQVNTKKIEKIETKNGSVVFVDIAGRNDLDNTSGSVLSEIQIKDRLQNTVKGFALSTSYFSCGNRFQDKRLKLDEVVEYKDQNIETNRLNPYSFSYNSSTLPERDSKDQDHWGYYNDKDNSTLVPTVVINGTEYENANREVNPNSLKGAVLEIVNYPTGGYSEYFWEPHTFGYIRNAAQAALSTYAGGLRVWKIVDHDGINPNNDVIRTYEYEMFSESPDRSSGVLVTDIPTYYYYGETYCQGVCEYLIVSTGNSAQIGYTKGSPVGYRKVREKFGITGQNGYIDYGFTSPVEYDDIQNNYYPFPPLISNDWIRGLLTTKTVYNSTGDLVHEDIVTYETDFSYDSSPTLYGEKYGLYGKYADGCLILIPNCSTSIVDGIAVGYTYENLKWKGLKSKTVKSYSENSNEEPITSVITYYYDGEIRPKEKEFDNSHGETSRTEYKYSYDYNTLPTNLTAMEENNIYKPIDIRTYKGAGTSNLIQLSQFNYNTGGELNEIYRENLDGNSSDVPFDLDNPFTVDREELFEYDFDGNITMVQKENDIPVSYLYGYENTMLIAVVENAYPEEIFHDSFEEGNINNWYCYDFTFDNSITSTEQTLSERELLIGNGKFAKINLSDQNYQFKAGKKYTVAVKAKLPLQTTNSPVIKINHNGSSTVEAIPLTGGWVQVQKTFTFSSGDVDIYLDADIGSADNLEEIYFDDVRVYPADAQMTTYTYDPLKGITSKSDPNGQTTYYEYDDFGRLKTIRDSDGNILQETDYKYAIQ